MNKQFIKLLVVGLCFTFAAGSMSAGKEKPGKEQDTKTSVETDAKKAEQNLYLKFYNFLFSESAKIKPAKIKPAEIKLAESKPAEIKPSAFYKFCSDYKKTLIICGVAALVVPVIAYVLSNQTDENEETGEETEVSPT